MGSQAGGTKAHKIKIHSDENRKGCPNGQLFLLLLREKMNFSSSVSARFDEMTCRQTAMSTPCTPSKRNQQPRMPWNLLPKRAKDLTF